MPPTCSLTGSLPEDRARVGSFSMQVRIGPAEFTSDHEALRRVLRDELQDPGPTPLWKATAEAMTALGQQDGRRVVLLFTDGQDSPLDPAMAMNFADVRTRAQAEEVMVYAIGLSDRCGALPAPSASDDTRAVPARRAARTRRRIGATDDTAPPRRTNRPRTARRSRTRTARRAGSDRHRRDRRWTRGAAARGTDSRRRRQGDRE